MPDIYKQISNKFDNTADPVGEIRRLKFDSAVWSRTPGGKIMATLAKTATFRQLFQAFTLHGRSNDWVWNPGIIGNRKGDLLDGTVTAGECALFAANLRLLAIAPAPYGLGIDAEEVEYWAFYGKHKQGFVAVHDHVTIMSPFLANVRRPELVQSPTRYYLWPNHKVLVHEGLVYDPSYGTISDKGEYLGLYQVKPDRTWSKPPKKPFEGWQPDAKDSKAKVVIDEVKYVVAGDGEMSDFLFRKVSKKERPEEPYQGPYVLGTNGTVVPWLAG